MAMPDRLRIAIVSPFVDKQHGTERCIAEQVERCRAASPDLAERLQEGLDVFFRGAQMGVGEDGDLIEQRNTVAGCVADRIG